MTWAIWNVASFRLETGLVSVQDRSMVCARHTIGSEIILDHLMELLGDVGHLECHFFPYRDSVSVGAR